MKTRLHLIVTGALIFLFLMIFRSTIQAQPTSYFIQNKGQVKDDAGNSRNEVLYYAYASGFRLYITNQGYSIVTDKDENNAERRLTRVDLVFDSITLNSDKCIRTGKEQPLFNYYQGSQRFENISGSEQLLIKNVYPGIDWLWRFDEEGNAIHEFLVSYKADASRIKYKALGANAGIKANNIEYANQAALINEGPIKLVGNKKEWPGAVINSNGWLSYTIPLELRDGGFTIDPPLELMWSSGIDSIHTAFKSIVNDAQGNNVTTGYSSDYSLPTFPQIPGSYVVTANSNTDAVIMKSNANQNLVWCTFFGGGNNDAANAVTATPSGIFITGYSESWDFPVASSGNYTHLVSLHGRDAFVAKFNNQGIWQWATGYGGDSTDEAMDIRYYNGSIYLAGYTKSPDFPLLQKSGAYFKQDTLLNSYDGFIAQFDTVGNRQWATCFGGITNDYFTSLAVAASGIYTTGYTADTGSTSIPIVAFPGAYNSNVKTRTECFVQKFTPGGALQWSTFFGGDSTDVPSYLLYSDRGLFVCGKTSSSNLPVQTQGNGNYYQPSFSGGKWDGFILKLNPLSLAKEYCTYFGTPANDVLTQLSMGVNGNTIFTGFTNGTLPVVNANQAFFHQISNAGGYDALVLGLDTTQIAFWATNFGTIRNDFGYGLQCIYTCLVDMVGEGLYNYGRPRIGGTYLSSGCFNSACTRVTCNGVSNRFLGYSCGSNIGGPSYGGGGGGGGGGCNSNMEFQALIPLKNTCPDQCNGVARVDTTDMGGCLPRTILWSSSGHNLVDTNLCENYWVRVTDAYGQARDIYGKFDVLRVSPTPPIASSCSGYPNWLDYILPEGGGPPYTIDLRGVEGDCPATAYFEIHDTAGCILSHSAQWIRENQNVTGGLFIDENCKVWVGLDVEHGKCLNFQNSASWNYVIFADTDTIVIPFNGNGTAQLVTLGIPGVNYTGYLNMGDCQLQLSSVYYRKEGAITVTHVLACGSANGSITVTVIPDSTGIVDYGYYSYNLVLYQGTNAVITTSFPITSTGSSSYSFTNLQPDEYTVTFSVSEGCDSSGIYVDLRTFDFDVDSITLFCGHSNVIGAHIQGGYAPFSYTWHASFPDTVIHQTGVGLSSLSVSIPGLYQVSVIDGQGCTISHVINVPGSPGVQLNNVDENLDPCIGNNFFSHVLAHASGGSGNLSYMWSSGEVSNPASYIPQGNNWVRVIDNVGCSDTLYFVNTKKLPLIVSDSVVNVSCVQSHNGKVFVSTMFGYSPFVISWSDGGSGMSRTNLSTGLYTYTVTDAKGCTASGSANVTVPDSIFYTVGTSGANCQALNGSAVVNILSGPPPVSISWMDNGSNSFIRTNLPAGNTSFFLTDGNGCYQVGVAEVDTIDNLSGTLDVHDVSCFGGSDGYIAVSLSGEQPPISYQWSNGTGGDTLFNLSSGTYEVTATDLFGCSFYAYTYIQEPQQLEVLIDTGTGISCNGSSLWVQFYASGGTPPYSGLYSGYYSAGDYSYQVTDVNGCVNGGSFSLTEPPMITDNLSLVSGADCFNYYATYSLSISGGFSGYEVYLDGIFSGYTQSGSTTIYAAPGSHALTINDSHGCSIVEMFNTDPYVALNGSFTYEPAACWGDSGVLHLTMSQGQAPFSVLGNMFTSSIDINLPADYYNLDVYDDYGCSFNLNFTIIQPDPIQVTLNYNPLICHGDSTGVFVYALGGTPPYAGEGLTWHTGGTYTATIVDDNGCAADTTYVLNDPPLFEVDTTLISPTCLITSATLTLSPSGGAYPYEYSTGSAPQPLFGTQDVSLSPGSYLVIVNDDLGCQKQIAITVVPAEPVTTNISAIDAACFNEPGGSITIEVLTGTPPYVVNGTAFTSPVTLSNLLAGTYVYTITDANFCSATLTQVVNQPLQLVLSPATILSPLSCNTVNNAVVQVNTSGGTGAYSYNLTGPTPGLITDNIFSSLGSGSYQVVVTDDNGCQANSSFVIDPFIPSTSTIEIDSVSCYGGNNGALSIYTQPPGRNPYTYSINGGTPQVYNVFYDLPAGMYTITIADSNNCIHTVTAAITQPDSIDGRVWLNGILLPKDSIWINERDFTDFSKLNSLMWNVIVSPYTNQLTYTDSLIRFQPRDITAYTVTVYGDSGCSVQYSGIIMVHDVADFPNFISPNGDGFNDIWEVDLDKYPEPEVTIFDRWGETVFESSNYKNDWNGTYKKTGKRVVDGTYFYILKVPSQGNKIFKGDINVLNSSN